MMELRPLHFPQLLRIRQRALPEEFTEPQLLTFLEGLQREDATSRLARIWFRLRHGGF